MSLTAAGPRSSNARGHDHARYRIAIVEDHLLQCSHTEQLIGSQPGFGVVFSGEDSAQLMEWLRVTPRQRWPHLVLLDLMADRGPSVSPAVVRTLVRKGIQVLVLSAMNSPSQVRQVLRAGVGGIVGKRDAESDILMAIWTVLSQGHWMTPELASVIATDSGRPQLSDQEERALVLYASGLTLNDVAGALGVQPDTAKKYLARVKTKYAAVGRPARTKLELNHVAQQDGLMDLDSVS